MTANQIDRLIARRTAIIGACAIAVLAAGAAMAAPGVESNAVTGESHKAVAQRPTPWPSTTKKAPLWTEDETVVAATRATVGQPELGQGSAGSGGPSASDGTSASSGCPKCSRSRGR